MRQIRFLVLLVLFTSVYGQVNGTLNSEDSPFYEYAFGITPLGNSWLSGGAFVAERDDPAAGINNPSGLTQQDNGLYGNLLGSFGGKAFNSDWNKHTLPTYLSYSRKVSQFSVAVGIANQYSYTLQTGPLPIRTPTNPDGNGETFDARTSLRLDTFWGAIATNLSPQFKIGITLGYDLLRAYERIWNADGSAYGSGLSFVIGGQYAYTKNLNIGVAFRRSSNINVTQEVEGLDLSPSDPEDDFTNPSNSPVIYRVEQFKRKFRMPWSIQTGATFQASTKFILKGMVNYQAWSQSYSEYQNQIQYHFGASLLTSQTTEIYGGFFTQNNPQINGNILYVRLQQYFLTGGIKQNLTTNLELTLGIMDSHLFNPAGVGQPFQQTVFITGLKLNR